MAEENSSKCTYFNSCYRKFTRKKNGCCYLHPDESCKIPKCKDKGYPLRHQQHVDMVNSADTKQNVCTILKETIPLEKEAIPR